MPDPAASCVAASSEQERSETGADGCSGEVAVAVPVLPPPSLHDVGQDPMPVHVHVCPECNAEFSTSRGMVAHRQRKHALRTLSSKFVRSHVCPVCSKDYGSRLRTRLHIDKWSPLCRQACLDGRVPELSPGEVEVFMAAGAVGRQGARKTGRCPTVALQPIFRAEH